MGRVDDISGQRFGKLIVISDSGLRTNNGETKWICRCNCGNTTIVTRGNLKSSHTLSCGCLQREMTSKARKKINSYNLSQEYGIGYTSNTKKEYKLDLEDFKKIKDYCWLENDQGYIITRINGKNIRMHRFIMNINDKSMLIDYKNLDRSDNRKENLRLANKQLNSINRKCNKNNLLGHKGVLKSGKKYIATIVYNGKSHYLGGFETINEAIEQRKQKEIELFGEFAYAGGE